MQRLLCILSGFSLTIFFFLSSTDVIADPGYTSELVATGTSRSYTHSPNTSNDDTDGNAQSRLQPPDDPGDDEGGGGEKTRITVTPQDDLASRSSPQGTNLMPVEQHISSLLNSDASLHVEQEDDQGHISISGNLALWLSHFLTGNNEPVQSLNATHEMLFIPEFFGTTFAGFVGATAPADTNAGTLVWINLPVQSAEGAAAEAAQQTIPLSIYFFTNIDGLLQMNLFMNHIMDIPAGTPVIATVVFQENIETNPLSAYERRGLRVRQDSMTGEYHVVGHIGSESVTLQKEKQKAGKKMSSISEENKNALALMINFLVVNDNETQPELIHSPELVKTLFSDYEVTLDVENVGENWQSVK